jgi:predicted enzyme related to lactoylglutathione lyase
MSDEIKFKHGIFTISLPYDKQPLMHTLYNSSMLNLSSLLLFSENPSQLIDFYKKILQEDPKWSGGDFKGFSVGSALLIIGPHDKVHGKNQNSERIIFNFETDDVAGEFQRMKEEGATEIAAPYHPGEDPEMDLATLADPDGNYFQLNSPMK